MFFIGPDRQKRNPIYDKFYQQEKPYIRQILPKYTKRLSYIQNGTP